MTHHQKLCVIPRAVPAANRFLRNDPENFWSGLLRTSARNLPPLASMDTRSTPTAQEGGLRSGEPISFGQKARLSPRRPFVWGGAYDLPGSVALTAKKILGPAERSTTFVRERIRMCWIGVLGDRVGR